MSMFDYKRWWQSLGVWGSLGTIVVGILDAIHIAHGADLSDDLNAWSAAAGVVITGLISLVGRLRATRRIGDPADNTPAVKMFVLILPLLVLFAGGCAADATSRWAQGRDGLNKTQDVLAQHNRAGTLPDKDFVALDPFVQAARGALKSAESQLPNGGPAFEFYMSLVEDTLGRLAEPNLSNLKEAPNDGGGNSGGDRHGAIAPAAGTQPSGARPAERDVHERAGGRDPQARRPLGPELRQRDRGGAAAAGCGRALGAASAGCAGAGRSAWRPSLDRVAAV